MTFVKRHDINEFISDNELNSRIYDILLYLQDSCKNGRIPLKRKPLEIFNQAYCLCEILAAEKYPENCIHALWNKTSEQFLDYETNIIFSCVCVILSFSETDNNNIPHCVQRIKNIVNSSYFSEFENVLNEDLSLTPELPKNFKQLKEQADLISNTSEKLLFYRKTLTQIKQSKNKKNIVQQIEDEIHLIESTQLIENTKQNDIPISTEKEIPTKVRTVVIMEMLKKMNCGKDVNDLSSICRLVALLTGRSYDKIYNEAQKGISFTNYHNEDIKKVNEVLKVMAKYKVIFRLRCENGVVYNIETGSFELPHKDWYYEHQATVNAMNILLGMADEFKEGNKKIVNYDIVWEE